MWKLCLCLLVALGSVWVGAQDCSFNPLQLDLWCFPNETFHLTNPAPALLRIATAEMESGNCTVTFTNNFTVIVITGCFINMDINITYICDGVEGKIVQMRCEFEDGITRDIEQGFTPILKKDTAGTTKQFGCASAIRENSANGTERFIGHVGEELYWTFDITAPYYAIPVNCTAFPGLSLAGQTTSFPLIDQGCSTDEKYIKDFSHNKSEIVGMFRRYYTEIHAFKFWNNDYICLWCTIKVCKKKENCRYTCNSVGRRSVSGYDGEWTADGDEYEETMVTLRLLEDKALEMGPGSGVPRTAGALWLVGACLFSLLSAL